MPSEDAGELENPAAHRGSWQHMGFVRMSFKKGVIWGLSIGGPGETETVWILPSPKLAWNLKRGPKTTTVFLQVAGV